MRDRTLAIGDIHGCSTALDYLLEIVAPGSGDTLITLGDYVNKGKDSKGVLDRMISLHERGNLVALKGNHEILMLEGRENPEKYRTWLNKGGKATLKSYSKREKSATFRDIPESHWHFLENICIDCYETENYIFVHANLDPDLPLSRQPDSKLFWEKLTRPVVHYSGKTVICGHTSQKNGKPLHFGSAICIDTWAWGKGWLTCLDVETGQFWQTNRQGQFKIGDIQNYRHQPWLPESKEGSPIFGRSFFSKALAISSRGK
ncbi:metallophosphoesterase family protein [Pannus brasiliensis CCIBt3594]|uniref:Metallophosphoesterase family protein n=1 Tax=Pannus brasiliensis CCIBt3594 TaxID=1427578 RepID=A0AAW9QPH8_9CHRO